MPFGTLIPKAVSERKGLGEGIKSICQILHRIRNFLDMSWIAELTYVTQLATRAKKPYKTIAASISQDHTTTLLIAYSSTGNT